MDQLAEQMPAFAGLGPLTRSAVEHASRLHRGQRRPGDGSPFILHVLEVGQLLHQVGCSDAVVAAGVLHDAIEHGDTTAEELSGHFDRRVVSLVVALTEDPTVASFRDRKAALRRQVARAGAEAATIFAADKVSRLRELRAAAARRRADSTMTVADRPRLEHYAESLTMLARAIPGHPLVLLVRLELGMLGMLGGGAAAAAQRARRSGQSPAHSPVAGPATLLG